jgi:hypothetical protein
MRAWLPSSRACRAAAPACWRRRPIRNILLRLFYLFLIELISLIVPRPFQLAKAMDSGGNIHAYAAAVDYLNNAGRKKAIVGVCVSACTMYLGVRKVCVDPEAELWFHAAHLPSNTRPDPAGSLIMLSHYPKHVRAWVIQVGALERTEWDGRAVLSGRQLIGMGIRACRK